MEAKINGRAIALGVLERKWDEAAKAMTFPTDSSWTAMVEYAKAVERFAVLADAVRAVRAAFDEAERDAEVQP